MEETIGAYVLRLIVMFCSGFAMGWVAGCVQKRMRDFNPDVSEDARRETWKR